ncbi:hypothetical protein ASB56_01285 [Mycoplasmopsis meleagridis]|nr:hypothetical protein ASB56_01285 [Mycoplasmopsis meleagridis]
MVSKVASFLSISLTEVFALAISALKVSVLVFNTSIEGSALANSASNSFTRAETLSLESV